MATQLAKREVDVLPMMLGEKATVAEVTTVEEQLGRALLVAFKDVLLQQGKRASFLPDDFPLADECGGIFSGHLS